jgi:hypothetical protein
MNPMNLTSLLIPTPQKGFKKRFDDRYNTCGSLEKGKKINRERRQGSFE